MHDIDRKVLMLEYGNLPGLIAHWDAHFWHKSQFFFAVESLLLGAVGVAFRETFLKGVPLRPQGFWVLVGVCIFNYWICYVWFRTNRSNREFLGPLFDRARCIEKRLLEGLPPGTFSAQWAALRDPKRDRHSAHWWENHLPTVFAVAWTAVLLTGGTIFPPSCEYFYFWIPWYLVVGAIASVVVVELLHPRRSQRHDPVEAEQAGELDG